MGVFQTILRETPRVGGSARSNVHPYLHLWCSLFLVTSRNNTSKHVHGSDSDPFAHTERRSIAREVVPIRSASIREKWGTQGNHPEGNDGSVYGTAELPRFSCTCALEQIRGQVAS